MVSITVTPINKSITETLMNMISINMTPINMIAEL